MIEYTLPTHKKDVGAYHVCSLFWPTTAKLKNRQRNTHAGNIVHPHKCAEGTSTLTAHYGEYIHTPRGSYQCIAFVQLSIVVVRITKNKAR